LIDLGYEVLQPIEEGLPYDLAVLSWTKNGWFREANPIVLRIQCKTARYIEIDKSGAGGYLEFNGFVSNIGGKHGYWGLADYFGVYCAELEKVYLVPVRKFPDKGEIRLRINQTKNNQKIGIHWAMEYEL
jgi:hypothetical protein